MVLDWLLKKKKKKGIEGEKYYLVFQATGTKGFVTLQVLDEEVDTDALLPMLTEAGKYLLQKRVGGKIVGNVWGTAYEVAGEAEAPEEEEETVKGRFSPDSDRVSQAIENDLVRAVRWFKLPSLIQESMTKALGGGGLGALGVGSGEKTTEDDVLNAIDKLKVRYDRMGKLFGADNIRGGDEAIYEGKVPIWFHPKVIPGLIDDSLEMVEKRLTKWGMIGGEEAPSGGEDLMNFPKKPEKKGDE